MIRAVPLLVSLAAPAAAEMAFTPGAISYTLQEHIADSDVTRFRFVQPDLAAHGFAAVEPDLAALCRIGAARHDLAPGASVIVSVADRAIAFGTTDAAVTQFFEAFTVTGTGCEVELF